ncbi:MAG: hypothetical protein WKF91_05265 [Segetibacter sp.]
MDIQTLLERLKITVKHLKAKTVWTAYSINEGARFAVSSIDNIEEYNNTNPDSPFKQELHDCLKQLNKSKEIAYGDRKPSPTDDTIKITLEAIQILLLKVTENIEGDIDLSE